MVSTKLDLEKELQYIEHNGKLYLVNIKPIKVNRCKCGCGKVVTGRKKTFSDACRKRVSRIKNNTKN